MTNKTEMVSDAELDELEVAEVLLAQQGFSNLAAAISAAYTFIKETRAAPAEDVRAVGEEPVTYSYRERVWATGLGDYVWREKLESEAPTEDQNFKDLVPLYRHPQRPVVLPGRKSPKDYPNKGVDHIQSAEWNACLDTVEELNK